MGDIIGQKFLSNGKIKSITEWDDQIFYSHSLIYEVVRVEDSVPLFFEDYYERLSDSFALIKEPLDYSFNQLISTIETLLAINGCDNGPVKLLFDYKEPKQFTAYLMQLHVPTAFEYTTGVHTILLHRERINPNAKVWNQHIRNQTIEKLEKANAYEGILVNEEGFITEGSRSNVFFVKDGIVFTTPSDLILPGITRKKVLQLCESKGIKVKMKKIHSSEISKFDAVFLSGTSRKVLPAKTIDAIRFSRKNDTMEEIIAEFEKLVIEYIYQAKQIV